MAGRVQDKVALVTGAARGLGRTQAVRLASEGADVIVLDVCAPVESVPYPLAGRDDLDETVAQIEATGRRAIPAQVDIRDLAALSAAVDAAVAELGRLDIVVANAGVTKLSKWDEVTEEDFALQLSVNVTGTWNTAVTGARHLVAGGAGGSIILLSSTAGLKAQPFMAPYVTTKFAVRGMAKALALELARHHIRVNSLHPTGVVTGMGTTGAQEVITEALGDDPRLGAMFMNMLPVPTVEPGDIADAMLFLASDESRYVTAHELAPDAGNSEF